MMNWKSISISSMMRIRSKEWNLYKFSDALEMYKSRCRRWEEHHNGSSCVVERVRDKYLMPKIKDFLTKVSE